MAGLGITEGTLTEKLGPLPVWTWGLLAGGCVAIWVWRKQAVSTATSQTTGTAASSDTTSTDDALSALETAAAANTTGSVSTDTTSSYATNATWMQSAIAAASTLGIDPLRLQTALQEYENGGALDAWQYGAVSRVVATLGTPPEGIYGTANSGTDYAQPTSSTTSTTTTAPKTTTPVSTPAKTPAKVTKAPAKMGTYTIKYGDTLTSIAKAHGTTVANLAKLNGIANPNKISAGKVIKL